MVCPIGWVINTPTKYPCHSCPTSLPRVRNTLPKDFHCAYVASECSFLCVHNEPMCDDFGLSDHLDIERTNSRSLFCLRYLIV